MALAAWAASATAGSPDCEKALGNPALTYGPFRTLGTERVTADLAVVPGHPYLIEVEEHGNDALLEILDSKNAVMARSDHPERRSGTRRAVVTAPDPPSLTVRITGKEHAHVVGTATVRAFDLAAAPGRSDCAAILGTLAAADADYAAGQEISRGRAVSPSGSAHETFVRAADEYASAERALATQQNRPLRGETQLALAGLEYLDLQDWAKAAEWARTAAVTLGSGDPYRRARADALVAAAWIEIAPSAPTAQPIAGYGVTPSRLFSQARNEFQRLNRFHLARGEPYDAGMQQTNLGLSYMYQGRYGECIAAFTSSARVFGSIQETQRQAQAWQNRAICLWGLGRLAEARRGFDRVLAVIGPEPYPSFYLAAVTNTALLDYELGRFDESLQLYDRALAFAQRVQFARDEAYCLYGIGLNYYALGDRDRSRAFLERSLVIRTVTLDGRGRVASLRALATVDAEQGRVKEAIALDREALSLAQTKYGIVRIRIRLAVHAAAAGQLEEAKAQLDDLIASTAGGDRLVQAEALLQRAAVLRQMGLPRKALADLEAARPRLRLVGSVTEEFDANLELARTLRMLGQPGAALEAVERALGLADAVRLQTANPELRSQLQTPLRAAYDLKIDLLRVRYDQAWAQGRMEEANAAAATAFATADASRAHSFAEVAAEEYPPAIRRALAGEFRRREALYRQLAERRFTLDTRLDGSGSSDPRAQHLIAEIAELERQADTVNTAIATRAQPQHARNQTGRVAVALPKIPLDTVLVSYWLGSESAYAWVVSAGGAMHWSRLSSPQAIASQAAAFHGSLTRLVDVPTEQRLSDAGAVYESIVRPISEWLSGARQWVIIPDGALDYVPFAALRMADTQSAHFVVAQHDVAFAPAGWMLSADPAHGEPPPRGRLLLVADPVYEADDPRVRAVARAQVAAQRAADHGADTLTPEYRRLSFTGDEAARVAALFPATDVDRLMGLEATRERLLALDLSQYRFIHIAAHGVVDAQVPQLSALILGSYDASGRPVDGAVRVADLSLETLSADVAVFSACDTALGKEVPSEGLVGIGSTVLARGARAVVASLWSVSDESGARLMTEFYRHLLQDSMSAPAALGAAMRSVISREPAADPALWAAFQVSVVTLGPGVPGGTRGTGVTATTTRP